MVKAVFSVPHLSVAVLKMWWVWCLFKALMAKTTSMSITMVT